MEQKIMKSNKKSFWHLIAENDLYEMVEKSGYGEEEFVLFQKRRLRGSLLSVLAAIVPTVLINEWMAASAILFFVVTWRRYYTKEREEYQEMLYHKQVSWYVFQRLIVTYLQSENDSIYIILKKVLNRMEEGEFKTNLQRFIIDITDDPESVLPFITFAKNAAGGTDSSLTFMTALYNFKNYSSDRSVVNELSDVARREMMRGIHDIRIEKEKGFYLFPTKIHMVNVIPMFGFMISVAYYVITNNMNF
ncbi:hypothetical protein [Virgibacillus sp. Bac332]|uniref:hypothetical protein n=1 Tax=Virgibacillus sp. Bac332 TaxID=2419842 RepID=UPI000EF49314|nr:hypothetical protein [Virgibacillus sp. Bac332]